MSDLQISDLDRTLLRTDEFAEVCLRRTSDMYDLGDDFTEQWVSALHDAETTVSMRSLIEEAGLPYSDVISRLGGVGASGCFLYADGQRLLDRKPNIWVVTTAEDMKYQALKIAELGLTDRATAITGNKGEYLAERLIHDGDMVGFDGFPVEGLFERIQFVDDILENITPLLGQQAVHLYYLERKDDKYKVADADIPEGIIKVSTLDQIP